MEQSALITAIKDASKLKGIKALGVILRAAQKNREDQRIARQMNQGENEGEARIDVLAERKKLLNMLDLHKNTILDNLIQEQSFKIGANSGDHHILEMQKLFCEFKTKLTSNVQSLREMNKSNDMTMAAIYKN
jgi:hypothetical protein